MQKSASIAALLLLAVVGSKGLPAEAQTERSSAAAGSFRQAQELGLDLSLRPADLINQPKRAPPGSFRAAQDLDSPIGRDLGGEWGRAQLDDRDQPAVPEGPAVWTELERKF